MTEQEDLSSILAQQFSFYSRYANDIITDLENRRNQQELDTVKTRTTGVTADPNALYPTQSKSSEMKNYDGNQLRQLEEIETYETNQT